MYGGHIGHFGPLMFLKQVYLKGIDLVNAVEVAVYARIREKICNFKAKPDDNNIFGSAGEPITFLKDTNNKVLNPAQKPFRAIKQLLSAYTSPGAQCLCWNQTGRSCSCGVGPGLCVHQEGPNSGWVLKGIPSKGGF